MLHLKIASILMLLFTLHEVKAHFTCGLGNIGSGVCSDPDECCSSSGWCDKKHCDDATVRSASSLVSSSLSSSSAAASPRQRRLSFPDYANGNCSAVKNVMNVNVAYYQSWSIWREPGCNPVSPVDLKVAENGYTHIAYSFASIDSEFRLEPYEGNYELELPLYEQLNALKIDHPNLKTLIAIGGWTFNNPGPTEYRFSDAASSEENRQAFAQSCLDFCRLYDFNGIDVDWEFPGDLDHGGREEDKVNFALMVQTIRDVFDAADEDDFVITVATPISSERLNEGYDLEALVQAVDFFHIMSYNIYTPNGGGTRIGANTDMPFIFDSLQYVLDSGVAPNKIVLGLAAYGRSYVLSDPTCATKGCLFVESGTGGCGGTPGFIPNFSIDEFVEGGNYLSLTFNPDTGTAELHVDETLFISFDDPESYALKFDYATESCFRGVMWWSADMKKVKSTEAAESAASLVFTMAAQWQQWLMVAFVMALSWR